MARKNIRFDSAVMAGVVSKSRQRLGWRLVLTLLLLALVALLSLLLNPVRRAWAAPAARPIARPIAQSTADPLVVAFYYPWFDESTWTPERLSDLPAQPYTSRDREAMGRQIDQAKAAGIDAFVVAWYGPTGATNQTEENLRALLEEAAARDFRIAILFETDSPFLAGFNDVGSALQHALTVHATQPAYLRADGRPVIFFWRSNLYGAGDWAALRDQVDPGRGSLWIGDGVDTSQLTLFDGHFLYSNTWNPPADLAAINQKFANQVAAMSTATGAPKLWVATVMPGYDDTRVRPGSGFARDRAGGAYYAQSWQAAIASAPDWIAITSFNEWPEGSQIEPSASYGDQYMGLTATWGGQFKASSPQETPATATSAADGAAAAPEPATPTAYVQAALVNLRAGPATTFAVLGQAALGDALPIVGRQATPLWWQVESATGKAWVFGELVRGAGPLDQVLEQTAAAEASTTATDAEPASPPTAPTAYVTVDLANLRAGPATTAAILGQAALGTALPIVGRYDNPLWWQVSSPAGAAWIFGELVRSAGPLDQVPASE